MEVTQLLSDGAQEANPGDLTPEIPLSLATRLPVSSHTASQKPNLSVLDFYVFQAFLILTIWGGDRNSIRTSCTS